MRLSPIDALPIILLFLIYFKSQEAKQLFADLGAKGEENDRFKSQHQTLNNWNAQLEESYQQTFAAIARGYFQVWISPRSFAACLSGALATLALGFTSVPGFIAGFAFSSPKLQSYLIRIFHAVAG